MLTRDAGTSIHGVSANRFTVLLLALVPALAPLLLFRHHVLSQGTHLGNPDRLNSHLKVLKFHVDELARGYLTAWNPFEMLGYDTFALPYTFPSPLTFLVAAAGPGQLYVTAGFVAIALLILAGLSAYAFLYELTKDPRASAVGAAVYQLADLTILKVSQNDLSFTVLIVIPLALLSLRRLTIDRLHWSFAALAALIFVMLHFMFLQKAAYALILIAAYAAYQSWTTKRALPLVTYAAAFLAGAITAAPRIIGVGLAMTQYVRRDPGRDLSTFKEVYRFQNIHSHEILRWFDGSIFGAFPSEAAAVHNNINLTEGLLAYAGAVLPLLIIVALVRFRNRWGGLVRAPEDDVCFFAWTMIFAFLVVVSKPFGALLYYLFLGVDFTHARFLIVGIMALAVIGAAIVKEFGDFASPSLTPVRRMYIALGGIAFGVTIAIAVELVSREFPGFVGPAFKEDLYLRLSSVVKIAGGAVILGLALASKRWIAPRGQRRVFAADALAALLISQALLSANFQVNGAHVRDAAVPFHRGDMYAVPREALQPPGPEAIAQVRAALESDRFRAVLRCAPNVAGGICAAHAGSFWHLRLAEGYYGLGVPARLAALPWGTAIGLRSIGFTDQSSIPWALLALMNVKYLVDARTPFLFNSPNPGAGPSGPPSFGTVYVNPMPVTPRVFFPSKLVGVGSVADAVRHMSVEETMPDLQQVSFVEDRPTVHDLAGGSAEIVSEDGDRIEVAFLPSDQQRFLVLNELYFPGWTARVNGTLTPVVPTNAFMRGIFVPPGATRAIFAYVPFVRTTTARVLYTAGAILFLLGIWLSWRWPSRMHASGRGSR
jgi:hypothetical protein